MKNILIIFFLTILSSCNPLEIIDDRFTSVEYLHINFKNLEEKYGGLSKFEDSATKVILTKNEKLELLKILNKEEYWSEGECGTFDLDGGFYIKKFNIKLLTVEVGCGFGQFYFSPFDPKNTKGGSLTELGNSKIDELIEGIKERAIGKTNQTTTPKKH